MPGRHRDNKHAETMRAVTPVAKAKGPKVWPKGKKQTPSDTDKPVFTSQKLRKI